jgi:tRNA(Ile2) C34 agmatinyltransferase TiaS
MVEVYVRVRKGDGTYEKVEVGADPLVHPGLTRYFDCKKCGKRVASAGHLKDSRCGFCFNHMPRDGRLVAEPRTDLTLHVGLEKVK